MNERTGESVVRLETVKTDVEKAAEYKRKLSEKLSEVCTLYTDAKREGIMLSFQLQFDAMGRFFVGQLMATKEL